MNDEWDPLGSVSNSWVWLVALSQTASLIACFVCCVVEFDAIAAAVGLRAVEERNVEEKSILLQHENVVDDGSNADDDDGPNADDDDDGLNADDDGSNADEVGSNADDDGLNSIDDRDEDGLNVD